MPAWLLSWIAPLLKILLEDIIGAGVKAVQNWNDARKQAALEKQQGADYQKVVDDPNATREQRKDAEGNVLNG